MPKICNHLFDAASIIGISSLFVELKSENHGLQRSKRYYFVMYLRNYETKIFSDIADVVGFAGAAPNVDALKVLQEFQTQYDAAVIIVSEILSIEI